MSEWESEKDNTKAMDKVECVDWPTQNVDRDKIPMLLSLSFNRMRVFTQSNTYTDIFICCWMLIEKKISTWLDSLIRTGIDFN